MTQRRMGSLGRQAVQVVIVSGCMIGLLTGCSSRSRTTIVSGSEAQKVQVTQLEPETVAVEDVVAQPVQKEGTMDVPVEAPASPASRAEMPTEIFATPKSTVTPAEISSFSETPAPVPADEPMSIEPEMPPLARGFSDEGISAPQADIALTPAPPAAQEPVQVAKVMPPVPVQVEMSTKTLEAALSDIYFDYDQFAIRDDAEVLLKTNARLLSEKLAEKHIVIEGHCDERGTQSYNMVLGARRAKAVKHFLQDLGVPAENLQVVSYGKDRPFCTDQSEACWQENRRSHFVIK